MHTSRNNLTNMSKACMRELETLLKDIKNALHEMERYPVFTCKTTQ